MRQRNRLYCVGTAKSGTHSVAELFSDKVRSEHEAGASELLPRILGYLDGRITREEITSYIHARDQHLCLEVDSSQLNYFVLDILLAEFPAARFVLTIRDAYSWASSFIDDSLRRRTSDDWVRLRELRFGHRMFTHPIEEQILKDRGLYTLDGYLSYWRTHNEKVLSSIPAARLFVLRTNQITQRASELADLPGCRETASGLNGRTHLRIREDLASCSNWTPDT